MIPKIIIPPLSIIVCCDENGGFGKDGKIPWDIPEDMTHFKDITKNNICIMGRNTYEDMYNMVIKNKKRDKIKEILVNRTSLVVSSKSNYVDKGAVVVPNIRAAIQSIDINDLREIFIIGGYRMFMESLTWTKLIYMTIIKNKTYDCDKHFPIEVLKRYKIINGQETKNLYFLTYKRGY